MKATTSTRSAQAASDALALPEDDQLEVLTDEIAAHTDHLPVTLIQPSRGWVSLGLHELWAFRELLFFLTWRDIKVRYKQTALGASWAIFQPFLSMVVFSLFFGKLAKIDSDGQPYAIWNYAAMVPWTFFANGLSNGAGSLVTNSNLVKKVYFPRLCMPISAVLSGLVDFALAFVILLVMMPFYHVVPTVNIIWLPFFLFVALVTSLGVGMWLAALNVKYRDVRYVLPFLVQMWMFASPVVYSSSAINKLHPALQFIYNLNPMVGIIDTFRWALLNTATPPGPKFVLSCIVAVLLLVGGAIYFRRTEKSFADIV